jgi:hypothetical protein
VAGISTSAHADSPKTAATTSTVSSEVTTKAWGDFIHRVVNVRTISGKCGTAVLAEASGRGHMTLRIDETESVSTTLSTSISASKGAISAAVGWDVTKSRSITVSGSREVPRGEYGVLRAYTRYSGKKFDVQQAPQLGNEILQRGKTAYKPIGVCFKYSTR